MSRSILPEQLGKRDDGERGTAGLEPGGWLPDVRTRLEAIVADEVSHATGVHTGSGPDFGDSDRPRSGRTGSDRGDSDRPRSDRPGSDRGDSDRDGSRCGGPVAVFDFDNTLICRDLGDAVLHRLVSEGFLDRSTVASSFSPSFGVDGERRRLKDGVLAYYEALQQEAVDQDYDPEPRAAAYAWAVQVMAGLTPAQVVAATKRAMDGPHEEIEGAPRETLHINGAVPFPYPEMVGLLGFLLAQGVRVFIVSATNVWTTRWAVLNVINPLLRDRFGDGIAIRPECIVGISVLMKEKASGRLVSDARLLGTDPDYRRLDADALSRFELTPLLSFPVSTYAGKVGCLRVLAPGERPILAAGDSDNDLPLLTEAKHRLWIARLEEPILQQRVADTLEHSSNWLVQPVLTGAHPGFVTSQQDLLRRDPPDCAGQSLTPWRSAGFLREL